jgi:hypothetical protein
MNYLLQHTGCYEGLNTVNTNIVYYYYYYYYYYFMATFCDQRWSLQATTSQLQYTVELLNINN